MLQENSLLHYGFRSTPEAIRLNSLPTNERYNYFSQQLESYINHLAKDEAVSILYKYWLGNNSLYTSASLSENSNVKYQIDHNERRGLFYTGILSAVSFAIKHKNNLIALYSPAGKKLFNDTPTDSIDSDMLNFLKKSYKDGQLYFLYFDGEKINNVSVAINSDNNSWLQELSEDFSKTNLIEDEEERISTFLLSPQPLGNIEDFFNNQPENNHLIYTNESGKNFYLEDVILEMKKTFSGNKEKYSHYFDTSIKSLQTLEFTSNMVSIGYRFALANFMRENGLSEINLGGGCGGSSVNASEIDDFSPKSIFESFSSFSSNYRYLTQHKKDYKDDPSLCHCGNPSEAHFHCPGNNEKCRHPIVVGNGTTKCPSCGMEATCK